MRRNLSSRWPLSVGLLAGLVLLGGCSSSDDTSETADTDASGGTNLPGNNNLPGGDTSQPTADIDKVPSKQVETSIGNVLIGGDQGLTLYTRPGDTVNTNTCTGICADSWPPLLTDVTVSGGNHAPYDILDRGDGTTQWTFKGYPLYFYNVDVNSAETTGNGNNGEWYVARPDPFTSADTSLGETLVANGSTITAAGDPGTRNQFSGRTLYVFADDTTDNVSNCNDACADNWPPLYADIGAVAHDNYSLVTRADGTIQWAFNTDPLYFYKGDNAPGDISGNDVPKWSAVLQ